MRCSYVRIDKASGCVADIHEKEPVSNTACTGIYFWKSAADFLVASKALIQHKHRHRGMYFLAPVYNEAICSGLRFKVVPAKACWSVRNVEEIGAFATAHVSSHGFESMKAIYDEMQQRQALQIKVEGYTFDPLLNGENHQRCFAAYTLCNYENLYTTGSFDHLVGTLEQVFGVNQVMYRLRSGQNAAIFGQLHMTLMQLVGFNVYGTIPIPEDYSEVLESIILRVVRPFEVHFNRIIVTRGSVLLVGHPTTSLNHARDDIRKALARIDYPLYEPYRNDIAHMTLVRFANPLSDDQVVFLKQISTLFKDGRTYAKMSVSVVDISVASWKMQPADLAGEQVRRVELV